MAVVTCLSYLSRRSGAVLPVLPLSCNILSRFNVKQQERPKSRPTIRCYSSEIATDEAGNAPVSSNSTPALVSTAWLNERIAQKQATSQLRVVDVSWHLKFNGKEQYDKEHLPGSIYLDWMQCAQRTPLIPFNLPEVKCFSEYVSSLGISNHHHIVVYDRSEEYAGFLTAPRAWWMFKVFGHSNVSVLDGGLLKWKKENLPLTAEQPSFKKGHFDARLCKKLLRSYEDIMDNLTQEAELVVDSRPQAFFSGEGRMPGGPVMHHGHVPGAMNVPLLSAIDLEKGVLRSRDELIKSKTDSRRYLLALLSVFENADVDLSKPMLLMCQVGITACGLALAADVAGRHDIPLYYGSWMEYGQRAPSDKVETGND